jgi:hypothetical protein
VGKRKPEPVVAEWAYERAAVEKQLAKTAAGTPGPDNPEVMYASMGGEEVALAKLYRLTEDGRGHAAVKFTLTKDQKISERAAPEIVGYRPASVLEYLAWLKGRPSKWLTDEIARLTGRAPRARLVLALAAYMASMYQVEQMSIKDERWNALNRQVEKHRFLADLPGLTEDEFFIHSLSGELNEDNRKMLLKTHTEGHMAEDTAVAEMKGKATAAEPASEVAKMKAEAKAKKANGNGKAKAEPKAAAKPANGKAKAAKASKAPKAPKAEKRPDKEYKKGTKVKYFGKNADHKGKTFDVLETRTKKDHSSVFLQLGEDRTWVSSKSVLPA